MFKIGPLSIAQPTALAPMAALTDPVFLLLGQEGALTNMLLNPGVFEATLEHVFQMDDG